MRQKETLEYIRELEGYMYISDLRGKELHWTYIIKCMDIKVFNLKEWEEAIFYITGKKILLNNYSNLTDWVERWEKFNKLD